MSLKKEKKKELFVSKYFSHFFKKPNRNARLVGPPDHKSKFRMKSELDPYSVELGPFESGY